MSKIKDLDLELREKFQKALQEAYANFQLRLVFDDEDFEQRWIPVVFWMRGTTEIEFARTVVGECLILSSNSSDLNKELLITEVHEIFKIQSAIAAELMEAFKDAS